MKTFHGKEELKKEVLKELKDHEKHDRIIKGKYWENGKGCAVGCLIKGRDHSKYETMFGIPEWLAHLEDILFEGLPNGDAKSFPRRFISAIPIGVEEKEITKLKHRFLEWILVGEKGVIHNKFEDKWGVKDAIERIAELHSRAADGRIVQRRTWESAAWSAESAAWSAESARSAARSAESSWSAAWSAESATWSAESARSAARSAESAESAAWSAESAAWSAESARSAHYKFLADKLIKMLKELERQSE